MLGSLDSISEEKEEKEEKSAGMDVKLRWNIDYSPRIARNGNACNSRLLNWRWNESMRGTNIGL
jgi:hypothetical protein